MAPTAWHHQAPSWGQKWKGACRIRADLLLCGQADEMEWQAAGKKPEPQLTGGWPKLQGQRNYPRTPKKITTWEVLP